MTGTTVVVYTKPDCQPCRLTKRHLDRLDIPYETRDVTADPDAYQAVVDLGYQGVPVVVTPAGEHWHGYRPDEIKALAA